MNIQIEVCMHLLIDVNERSSSYGANNKAYSILRFNLYNLFHIKIESFNKYKSESGDLRLVIDFTIHKHIICFIILFFSFSMI